MVWEMGELKCPTSYARTAVQAPELDDEINGRKNSNGKLRIPCNIAAASSNSVKGQINAAKVPLHAFPGHSISLGV